MGKTTTAKKYGKIIDLDHSPYKYDYGSDDTDLESLKSAPNRKKNPNFPQNYIDAIKSVMVTHDIFSFQLAKR